MWAPHIWLAAALGAWIHSSRRCRAYAWPPCSYRPSSTRRASRCTPTSTPPPSSSRASSGALPLPLAGQAAPLMRELRTRSKHGAPAGGALRLPACASWWPMSPDAHTTAPVPQAVQGSVLPSAQMRRGRGGWCTLYHPAHTHISMTPSPPTPSMQPDCVPTRRLCWLLDCDHGLQATAHVARASHVCPLTCQPAGDCLHATELPTPNAW